MLQSLLELRDFAGLAIAEQPVVRVAAVVAVHDDFHVVIDRPGVLHRFPGAGEFGFAVVIPAVKIRDGGFGDHHPVGIDSEIIVARDHAGKAVHQHAVTLLRNDVENNAPALAVEVAGPVVVGHHDLVIFRPAAVGDEGAAIFRAVDFRGVLRVSLLVDPGNVVAGQLLERIEGDDVVEIEVHFARLEPVHDAFELGLILGIDFRPQHRARRRCGKIPSRAA